MKNTASAYVVIAFAVIGLLTLVSTLRSFDAGTMNHPHVISLRK
jgi:hypothetical protein